MSYAHVILKKGHHTGMSAPTLAPRLHTRARRERVRLLAVLAVTVAYAAFMVYMLYLGAGEPSLGMSATRAADGTWQVNSVVPAGLSYDAGVRPGDSVVLAIDAQGGTINLSALPGATTDFSQARVLLVQHSSAGAANSYVPVDVTGNGSGNELQRWVFTLLSVIFISVGAPVYIKARQREAATTFYLFCIATAVILPLSCAVSAVRSNALLVATFGTMIVWAASFVLFFLKFPVKIGKTRRVHNAITGIVGLSGLAVMLGYVWVLMGHVAVYEAVRPLLALYITGCVTAGLAILVRSLVAEKAVDVRQQLLILLGGTGLAVGPALLLSVLPSILFQHELVSVYTAALALGIMPVAFAYAITQHQLLGIRNFVRRSVVYVVMGFTVLLVFSVAAAALSAVIPDGWWRNEVGLLGFGLFVFIIALSYGWVQKRVERLVDRYIYHDAYDYKEALLQFSAQLASEQNLYVLTNQLVERTCRLMNLTCGVLLLAAQPGSEELTGNLYSLHPSTEGGFMSSLRLGDAEIEYKNAVRATMSRKMVSAIDKVSRTTITSELGTSKVCLEPYASYGSLAGALLKGLEDELASLGIVLRGLDSSAQMVHLDDGAVHMAGTTEAHTEHPTGSLDPDLDSVRSYLGVPLWTRSYFIGVLCLGGKRTGERFSRDDISLLSTLGSQAALAIYNAQLYEAREQALLDTITALAHAIEAKDTYTINHCEKITDRAVALAQAMSLPRQEVENIRLGSILHDVGKIGIPDAVLNKPSKLTPEEYDIIKQHAQIGARIVQSVSALQGVVPIVRHHQERYDGQGYPDGLRGEEIPIGARIIAVVDAYGAMTEDRVYRKALGHDRALAELKRHAGTQFDPHVVASFIRILSEQPELAELNLDEGTEIGAVTSVSHHKK
jgi:putative nucleotidyltransferase with HDIG domain